jgi:hypothetical protein
MATFMLVGRNCNRVTRYGRAARILHNGVEADAAVADCDPDGGTDGYGLVIIVGEDHMKESVSELVEAFKKLGYAPMRQFGSEVMLTKRLKQSDTLDAQSAAVEQDARTVAEALTKETK